jgi:hypothetical protein
MEFWPNLVVQEINPVTKEVAEKKTNPIPSFTVVSFVIPLTIKNFDCRHKDVAHAMLKENVMMVTPKNDNVVVNMVLAISTCSIVVMFQHQAPSQNLASL